MASIIKRGNSYLVQVKIQGVSANKTFPTKAQATAWAAQTETEIRNGVQVNKTGHTLQDALIKYGEDISSTKRGERWELIRINAWSKSLPFINYKISDISTRIIAEWRDDRLKTVKESTVNRELNLLASVFEQCRREWQWISVNPVRDVRRPPQPAARTRIFDDHERDAICVALGFNEIQIETKQQIIAAAFLFALETAMRRGEIVGLTWDRVNIKKLHVSLPLTKNGDARLVPLSKRAIEILGMLKDFKKPFDVAPDVLSTLFSRACSNADVEGATFHDARATALTRLASKLNVLELARVAGHRDIRSLQIYYRERVEDLAAKIG